MNKQVIIDKLTGNYGTFVDYTNGLTVDEYLFSYEGKWNVGEQLAHLVLCVKPLVAVFGMDKPTLAQNFGRADKPGRSYDLLLVDYLEKLKEGGKAPARFLPETVSPEQRAALCATLMALVQELCLRLGDFTEDDLDSYCLPHPLLGNLTMREMLYNAFYHVQHHQEQAVGYLKCKG